MSLLYGLGRVPASGRAPGSRPDPRV